jgi:pimeloyl-ACP methyl ester carboxylesterase
MSTTEDHGHPSGALQQAPGLWRTDLQRQDLIPPGRGHFAAWEEPQLFATEVRAAFKSVR